MEIGQNIPEQARYEMLNLGNSFQICKTYFIKDGGTKKRAKLKSQN